MPASVLLSIALPHQQMRNKKSFFFFPCTASLKWVRGCELLACAEARGQTGVSQNRGTLSPAAADKEQLLCGWETIQTHTYGVGQEKHIRKCQKTDNSCLLVAAVGTVRDSWLRRPFPWLDMISLQRISVLHHQVGHLTLHLNISTATWINICLAHARSLWMRQSDWRATQRHAMLTHLLSASRTHKSMP